MKELRLALAIGGLTAALGACVQFPQTPQETRDYIRTSLMGKVQAIEVDRSYREVLRTFQAKAPECLNLTVRTVERGGGSYSNVVATYRSSVTATEQRAELDLQEHLQGNVIIPGKEPEGGFYVVIADAAPLSANRTKVEIYSASQAFDVVVRAIAGWASGKSAGCPDMTKK